MRVKLLRTTIGLNQEKFGKSLGVTKASISKIEAGVNNLTDSMIKLICNEFSVSEHWLRTGEGEMFVQPTTFSLDEEAKKNNLSELEIAIMRSYMSLDRDTRNKLMDELEAIFRKKISSEIAASTVEPTPEQIAEEDGDDDIEMELKRYRLELEAEKKGKTLSAFEKHDKKLG